MKNEEISLSTLNLFLIGVFFITFLYRVLPVILVKFNILKQTPKSKKFAEAVSAVLLGGIIISPIFPHVENYTFSGVFNQEFVFNLSLLLLAFFLTKKTNSPNRVFFTILSTIILFYGIESKF